jgi:DNA-binding MarR family transcriptional regulator
MWRHRAVYAGPALPRAFQSISWDPAATGILLPMKSSLHSPPGPLASIPPDSLVVRTLLATARQRPGLNEARCRLVLEWLRTGATVRAALRETLASCGLTGLRFAVLIVLFTLDPEPTTPADLASHAGVSRAAITGALDDLHAHHLVERERDAVDRRTINIRLTDAGRKAVDSALQRLLQTAGHVARFVEKAERAVTAVVCERLKIGAGVTE